MEKKELVIDYKNGNLFDAFKSLLSYDLLQKYFEEMATKGKKTDAKTTIGLNNNLINELKELFSKGCNKITLTFETVEIPKKQPKEKNK